MSNITLLILFTSSKVELFLTNIELLAHKPCDTTKASGVARPSAQGQAITNIVVNFIIAVLKFFVPIKKLIKAIKAINMIQGTKTELILSAMLDILALELDASLILYIQYNHLS